MCTVIFFPFKEGVLLSSNRDENSSRAVIKTLKPVSGRTGEILYPEDPLSGGSWFSIKDNGTVIVLLNGAFVNHERKATYRMSRGLIITRLIDEDDVLNAWSAMDLNDVEPFTLVVWNLKQLFHLAWDGASKFCRQLPAHLPHIWSSSTLYSNEIKAERQSRFENFVARNTVQNEEINENKLLEFFDSFPDPFNGFVMNRSGSVQTLSISFIRIEHTHISLKHHDLFHGKQQSAFLKLSQSHLI